MKIDVSLHKARLDEVSVWDRGHVTAELRSEGDATDQYGRVVLFFADREDLQRFANALHDAAEEIERKQLPKVNGPRCHTVFARAG